MKVAASLWLEETVGSRSYVGMDIFFLISIVKSLSFS